MNGKGHKVVSDNDISLFNIFRDNMKGKEMSRQDIKKALHKELGYVEHDSFLKALCDGVNPPIIRIRRGVYVVSPKPVFKDRLQVAFDTYTKCANPRNYTATGKYEEKISIEKAIKVLKDAGYKVLKPITQYEEI